MTRELFYLFFRLIELPAGRCLHNALLFFEGVRLCGAPNRPVGSQHVAGAMCGPFLTSFAYGGKQRIEQPPGWTAPTQKFPPTISPKRIYLWLL